MSISNIWIFSLEPLETRYTAQWHSHLPKIIQSLLSNKFNVIQVDGIQKNSTVTPGAFLNFSDTNFWKSSQLCEFLNQFNQGIVTPNDHFIFTDAWNPVILQIKYMKDLLNFNWTLHGLWHAGNYDPHDFLGRLDGDLSWIKNCEKSFFHSLDHNYFASNFHINMFETNLLKNDYEKSIKDRKIVRCGWPMEYMPDLLDSYKNLPKKDLIVFPHRIAPEKQLEIFLDLKKYLPQYNFIVCQEHQLTKHEYHTLLGEAKIVFSANLQETLGISCYEGALVNAIPLVPDRLSYAEMYFDTFKYPSMWTESFDQYQIYRPQLCKTIIDHMEFYDTRIPILQKQKDYLQEKYFSANQLYEHLSTNKQS